MVYKCLSCIIVSSRTITIITAATTTATIVSITVAIAEPSGSKGRGGRRRSIRKLQTYFLFARNTGVCGKSTPPEKTTLGKMSFQSTKSGAGEQFLLQDCRAKAHVKGVCCLYTPVVLLLLLLLLIASVAAACSVALGSGSGVPIPSMV